MSVEDDLKKVNDAINDYEENHKIIKFEPPGSEEDLVHYLSMDHETILKLDTEDCAVGAYLLSQYSLYIQRLINHESANMKWINRKITEYTADKLNSYDKYMKHENKIQMIARENEVVKKLLKMQSYTETILDRLNFIPTNIKHMADMLKNIQGSKR